MTDHEALLQAQNWITFPNQAKNQEGWGVRYYNGSRWISEAFTLAEDAWSFFYAKLAELKSNFLNQIRQRVK